MKHPPAAEPCSSPPALDDLALIAAVDHEADDATLAHLARCPACAARAQAFADLQAQLRSRLFRLFCPSSEELAAFQQNVPGSARQADIALHVQQCPHCAKELRILSDMLGQPPPSSTPSSSPKETGAGPADIDRR
jgi:hypothetical protein